jgi:hypothetical protein
MHAKATSTHLVDVIDLAPEKVVFPFGEAPYVKIGKSRYGHQIKVDPTPAYRHDRDLALQTLTRVAHLFPIEWPVNFWLLPAESVSRTNGTTHVDAEYDYDGPKDAEGNYPGSVSGNIYLSAKPIPIHPAMTRYLVPHEYGHVVEEWLNKQRENGKLHDNALIKEYAELRGMTTPDAYGAGLWHCTPGEVFANDFRLLVCGMEWEFWPHPGVARPETVPAVVEWWRTRAHKPLFIGWPLAAKFAA